MDLSSLPSRPLTATEVAGLGESEAFAAVRPVERFEFEAVEDTLVVAVVFATDRGVRGVCFAPGEGWRVAYREDVAGVESIADVPESVIGEAQRALRSRVDELERERGFAGRVVDAYEDAS